MQNYPQYPEAYATIWRVDATKRQYQNSTAKLIGFSVLIAIVSVVFIIIAAVLFVVGTISLPVFIVLIVIIFIAMMAVILAQRGPQVSMQTIYAKQGGLLYRGMPVSKYQYIAAFTVLFSSVIGLLNQITLTFQFIRISVIFLALVFIVMGVNESKRMAASITDINWLIGQPLSQTVLICKVNQITEKAQYYKVNCVFMRVKPTGQYLSQKTRNITISKDYYAVETLIQELFALQSVPMAY